MQAQMKRLEAAFQALEKQGWFVWDGFLEDRLARRLRARAEHFWQMGKFRRGRTGATRTTNAVREDWIAWLSASPTHPAEQAFFARLARLRAHAARRWFISLPEIEAHYARYAPASRYGRHLDQIRDRSERVLTVVCYLNPDWCAQDGGALRLYTAQGARDVLPVLGRAVIFLSDQLEHEVLPASRPRFSIACWLRRRSVFPLLAMPD